MATHTPNYGIIDYKKYDDLLPSKPWSRDPTALYAEEARIKDYTILIKKLASDGVWFINVYELQDNYWDHDEKPVIKPDSIKRYFIDNYLNLWIQRLNSYPAAIYEDLKNTRSMLEKITYHNKFKNKKHYHEYLPKGLEKPLSDGIIDHIQKVWILPNDDTRIYVIHEYVRMYMENIRVNNELSIAHEQIIDITAIIPIIVKKSIDEEIAELQTRIMELYAERGKN
jgi:hypothetical protein